METDPVCDMQIDEQRAIEEGRSLEWHGRTYVFCGRECKERFAKDPAAFAITFDNQTSPDGKTNEGYAG